MLNQSIYPGILDLSSDRRVSGIMSVGPWNDLEANIKSTCSSVLACHMCGVHVVEDCDGWQPRKHNKVIHQHRCIEANIPLVCW